MALSTEQLHQQAPLALARAGNDNSPFPTVARGVAFPRPARRIEVDLPTLRTTLEAETGVLWATMKHNDRACCTPALVSDTRDYQMLLKDRFAGYDAIEMPFRYLTWRSESRGAFLMGGDLAFVTKAVRDHDEAALRAYAYRCCEVVHENYNALDLPIMTVALVQGDAIGGGFESMITNDLVIAERQAKFGLPEVLFNMFPGMGAYSLLVRKLGERTARELVEDGRSRSAEEMKALGLVDIVCEPGEAEIAFRRWHAENDARFNTLRTMRRACRRVAPLDRNEIFAIVDMWVDLALSLSQNDLRRMDCLARVQEKKKAN